jgi:Icc-related predicted phosphoesterase
MYRLFIVLLLYLILASAVAGQAVDEIADTEQNEALKIVVISDLNGSYGSAKYNKSIPEAISRIAEINPDLVISTGDMVAGQRIKPLLKRKQLESMWTAFHQNVSDPLADAQLPLAVTAGNHDGSAGKKFSLERLIYQQQWSKRQPNVQFVDNTYYPFYYAFSLKNVLFISLDATLVGHLPAVQKDWLVKLLTIGDAQYRHKVIYSHLPLWPFAQNRETEILGDHELEEILKEHDVKLYLSGHHHAFYPGYKEGIRYVSQACMGDGLYKYIGTDQRSKRAFTLIEIDRNDKITINAYEAPDFSQPVDFKTLPDKINSRYATLIREDLRKK